MEHDLRAAPSLLEVRDLKKYFPARRGLFQRLVGWVMAVDGVSFKVQTAATYSLVGESGCGKTTVSRVILLLEAPTEGTIRFDGVNIHSLAGQALRQHRPKVQAVFQDPSSSLNPRLRAGAIVADPLVANRYGSREVIRSRVLELLDHVGLQAEHATLYPHEFSGGQRQRLAIARALALNPRLIVLDEPVSALDVSIRAQIMNLLKDLQRALQITYLLIAHNLATVRYMSGRIGVMYLGRLVEEAESEDLFGHPCHPYTKALISAALTSHPDIRREPIPLVGEVPSPLRPPGGCRFHPRCPVAMPRCSDAEPEYRRVTPNDHHVACHLYSCNSY